MKIEKDKVVSVHYTGKFPESDEIFDTSIEREPMEFLVGHQNMIQGFEQELLGAEKGENREFTLLPEQAYGHRNEDAIQEVPREQFPDDLEVGMMFQAQSDQGPMQFSINEILEDTVWIDFNHPMAGKTLKFNVEVISIRDATEKEVEDGHHH